VGPKEEELSRGGKTQLGGQLCEKREADRWEGGGDGRRRADETEAMVEGRLPVDGRGEVSWRECGGEEELRDEVHRRAEPRRIPLLGSSSHSPIGLSAAAGRVRLVM
jgi:hypothetical protein